MIGCCEYEKTNYCNRFSFICSFCIGQRKQSDKIYWAALDKYTSALDSINFRKSEGDSEKIIYLEKPDYIDSIPHVVNGYKIIPITFSNQHQLYKEHKKTLIHTRVSPITIEDSLLHITFVPYAGKLKGKNHYFLAVGGGTTIYFKFDCLQQRFTFYKINNWAFSLSVYSGVLGVPRCTELYRSVHLISDL